MISSRKVTPTAPSFPLRVMTMGVRRFSVDEYHQLAKGGILTEDDNIELLEGYLVPKMTKNPPHDGTLYLVHAALSAVLPDGWLIRSQSAVTLTDSEPEPDLAIARANPREYLTRHPVPSDLGLVIEVADSSLASDRVDKGRIYSRAGIGCYWVVNVQDFQIEVYTSPSGPVANPAYTQRQDYLPDQTIPFMLDGRLIATIPVQDLLP